ncbi:hypothetical protein [Zavarzinia sp. CC-PAN008]|uniref:hypothetical protein n=1 Tax=Zavarzinia sp. CC-PAN008 TaxID=3243332 RepID=UPI003F74843C
MKTNHQRGFKAVPDKVSYSRVGDTRRASSFADVSVQAKHTGAESEREKRRGAKGAKKFVNSRIRFHENAALKQAVAASSSED